MWVVNCLRIYILDVNLVNRTNYKLNVHICEKKGNGTLIWAVSLHFERCLRLWIIQWEPSLKEIDLCSDWSAILQKNKSLILHVLSATGDLAEWSVAQPLDLRQWVRFRQGTFLRGLGDVYMEEGQPSLPRSRVSVKFFVKICSRLWEEGRLWEISPRRAGNFHINAPKRAGPRKRASKSKLRTHDKGCLDQHFLDNY